MTRNDQDLMVTLNRLPKAARTTLLAFLEASQTGDRDGESQAEHLKQSLELKAALRPDKPN